MLGKVINRLRNQQTPPWTQLEYAIKAGVVQSLVSQIETGVIRHPNTDTLAKLAGPFGLSASELLRMAEEEQPTQPTEPPAVAVA